MLAKHVIENKVNSVINTNKKGNAWWIFNFPFNKLDEPVFVLSCDNITNIDFSLIEKDYKKKGQPECFLIPVKPIKNLDGDYIDSLVRKGKLPKALAMEYIPEAITPTPVISIPNA